MSFTKHGIEDVYKGRFISGNRIELLRSGFDSFSSIFTAINGAKQNIYLQFYIIRNDSTGRMLSEMLMDRAKSGVKVYLLYDQYGSLSTPVEFWNRLKAEGVQIRASHPFNWRSPFRYQFRDHRKVLIVDEQTAFIGGLNIGDEYRGILTKKKKPWRDTVVKINGPAASNLAATFKTAWGVSGGMMQLQPDSSHLPEGNLDIIPIFAHSGRGRRRLRRLLYYSINHAKKGILLTTAYFIPSKRMIETLEAAERRGVDVRLIVPGQSDVKAAYYTGRAFYARLLKAGVEIFEYRGPMLHAKSYVFDGQWSIVGSANLDFRSLRWNDEGNVGILDTAFASEMTGMFDDDVSASEEITLERWAKRPFKEKLIEAMYSLFRRRL